jgi:putative FmdB family regulatory protein
VPTYTYKCTACEDIIEKRQSFSDSPLTTCEQCGGALRKVIHPVGIVFKGSGWYITDSRSSSSASSNGRSSSSSGESETKSSAEPASTPKDSGKKDSGSSSESSTASTTSSSASKTD